MEKPATYWMLEPLRKYATFSGRARRAEYWWFSVFCALLFVVLTIIDILIFGREAVRTFGIGPIGGVAALALFLPSIAVLVRRLHDRDKSGWWYWIVLVPVIGGLYLLYQYVQRGTEGPNRFGPDPLAPDIATVFE